MKAIVPMTTARTVLEISGPLSTHWVGNGFPVRTLLSPQVRGHGHSPFLLLDYAGPHEFAPTEERRGVEEHPHRGFETVTIVYQGELEHRDSAGHQGRLGPGDVQWMTAASGIVHEEMHERGFARRGGVFEVAQLWVNLPAAQKLSPPRYQELPAARIPVVTLPGGAYVRVIAGDCAGIEGAARTVTPLNLWDVRVAAGRRADLKIPEGHHALVALLRGEVTLDRQERLTGPQIVLLGRDGDRVVLEATSDAGLLLLTGEPLDEPIASYGPFVMNTEAEIRLALEDYRSGKMGHLAG
jgi:redox-sensitive bicupin YhaK (pirin superfamily)